jgi:glycosyltransferase involved in cell wall biosynthesis
LKRDSIIFYGELFPNTIHGISISNSMNIKCLNEKFNVDIIEEKVSLRYHNIISLNKIIQFVKSLLTLLLKNLNNNYKFFYSPVSLSSFGILKNILCVLIFKILNYNSKVILHFHRGDFLLFTKKITNRILFSILKLFVHKFISLSKTQSSELKNYGLHNCDVLYNTVLDNFKIKTENKKIRKSDFLSISFISNYIKEKGIVELIDSVIDLNQKKIQVVLNCYGNYSDFDFENEIKILIKGHEDYINLNNFVIGEEKISVMSDSDLVILPSYNEGVPIIMLECLKLGKPIIISNVGYISEFLGIDYPLYCEPRDYKSIIKAIDKYISISDKILFSKNLQKMFDPFSFGNHKSQILKIFN